MFPLTKKKELINQVALLQRLDNFDAFSIKLENELKRIQCVSKLLTCDDTIDPSLSLTDIIETTREILNQNKGTTEQQKDLMEAVAQLKPFYREVLHENDTKMLERFKFILEQTRICDATTFNCRLPDIMIQTLQILGEEKGTSNERKNLLKAVVSLQPLPGEERDGCNNVINILEKHARPKQMEHFHLLGRPSVFLSQNHDIAKHNKAIAQELIGLGLLSEEEMTTLLWHINHYNCIHKHGDDELLIKHHSDDARHLPRSLEVDHETIIVKFKSKIALGKKDKKQFSGSKKQFSYRLHVNRRTHKLSLKKGELRPSPRHRNYRLSQHPFNSYADLTAVLFRDTVSITKKIIRRELTDCIVTLGKQLRSKSKPKAIYYEVSHTGLDLIKLPNLDQPTLFSIIDQALSKLEKIHKAGLCGLDIKPDNMIWTKEGKLLFIDTDSAVAPNTQPMKDSTTLYLAPEFYQYLRNTLTRFHDDIRECIKINQMNAEEGIPHTPFDHELTKINLEDPPSEIKKQLAQKLKELLPDPIHRSTKIKANNAADVYALGKTFQILLLSIKIDNTYDILDDQTKEMVTRLVTNMCAINPDKRFTLQQARVLFDAYNNGRPLASRISPGVG